MTTRAAPLTSIVWHVGGCVEKLVDAVATVAPHHGEAVGLGVLLNDIAQLPVTDTWFHCRREWRKGSEVTAMVMMPLHHRH